MKFCLYILAIALSLSAGAQSICGTANENGTVTLTAPAGKVFTTITFASYGTPNGSCGSFTIGGCNASNSKTLVEAAFLNKNSASIDASNSVFGDPCSGTVKRLYIEAVYSFPLPLHLVSFSCTSNGNSTILQWQTADEVNTHSFEVERSKDGVNFTAIAKVAAANVAGTNLYAYTDGATQQTAFYRLKMVDEDGSFTYSNIIKAEAGGNSKLSVFPNPVTNFISVAGTGAKGYLEITNVQGITLKRLPITGNSQTFSMAAYPAGVYILKYTSDNTSLYQKVMKQ